MTHNEQIFLLWFLDSSHIAFITHASYFYMVSNFGNFGALIAPTWSSLVSIYLALFSDTIIRSIFGRRVWLMTRRSKVLVACIATTSLTAFAMGSAFASRAFSVKTFANFAKISYLMYSALGSGVAADILIAGSLCISLSRSRTGFKKTDTLVNLLIMYAINTGLLTTVCFAACFITYAIWPNEFTFVGIYFTLPKLYLNSLLATLNSREALAEKISGVSDITMDLAGTNYPTKASNSRHAQSIVVNINREVISELELGKMGKGT